MEKLHRDHLSLTLSSSSIQPLAPEVVSLMAAGEVIDSLSAVVRELVENALDAGATRIAVSVWPERWQVRVADNGSGMTKTDLRQAAIAHATSKISTRPDLLNVRSLGFRGEALHSMAQLAQLEIRSCVDGNVGYQVSYAASGEPETVSEMASAPGTIVTVRDLFLSWPARRQVPQVTAQLKAVTHLIQQLALCHPQVTWQVEKNGAAWFSLWPGPTAKTIMPQVLRSLHDTDIDEISEEISEVAYGDTGEYGLYLAVGLPDRCHRRKPDWLRIAINGRPVVVEELAQTITAGFRRTIPRDRYPICFLHLRLPPTQLDWNRHPAKSEIYVQGLEALCDRVSDAVGKLLKIDDLSATAQTHRATQLIKAAEAEGDYSVSRQVSEGEVETGDSQLPTQSLSDSFANGNAGSVESDRPGQRYVHPGGK